MRFIIQLGLLASLAVCSVALLPSRPILPSPLVLAQARFKLEPFTEEAAQDMAQVRAWFVRKDNRWEFPFYDLELPKGYYPEPERQEAAFHNAAVSHLHGNGKKYLYNIPDTNLFVDLTEAQHWNGGGELGAVVFKLFGSELKARGGISLPGKSYANHARYYFVPYNMVFNHFSHHVNVELKKPY
ncbi:hypothetical protein BCV70DRAFT_197472 [Testicularia cyperi]|uniref:Uncharacterized protein n=1 Tax=Testicularia cyperi TaxID=1882483 RepID=A0A317XY69_9BASI|nr:hypothetical protein BCV70DRAFT_197472 [Testicularia cyperi]